MAGHASEGQARELLLAAMAAEHELYRAAAEERAAEARWEARARLADRKEASDLAAAARARAAAHRTRARAYAAEYARQQAHVTRLKQALWDERRSATPPAATPWTAIASENRVAASGPDLDRAAPPNGDSPMTDTILEAQLAELKQRLRRA